jgi:hypothetical protein
MDGKTLLLSFEESGFDGVVGAQLPTLAAYLEQRAVETGLAAFLFIAEAIHAVKSLFDEHNEAGGIRTGFLSQMNDLAMSALPRLSGPIEDPARTAQSAQNFRDIVVFEVTGYDVRKTYD